MSESTGVIDAIPLIDSILVIDSGVGGLSVVRDVVALNPNVAVTYLADDAFYPYGLLSEQALRERLLVLVEAMLAQLDPSLVVIACNTASTLLLPELRARFDLPFVGVVPAIKPAALASRSKHIAVLATPATVERDYLQGLVTDFASDCKVLKLGSSELVHLAEQWMLEGKVDESSLAQELAPIRDNTQIDTLVLGCTHFPLLREAIQGLLPELVLVDSGQAIARRVESLLSERRQRQDDEAQVELVLSTKSVPTNPVLRSTALTNTAPTNRVALAGHQLFFTKSPPNSEAFLAALARVGLAGAKVDLFSTLKPSKTR